jgi:hypothetical protein
LFIAYDHQQPMAGTGSPQVVATPPLIDRIGKKAVWLSDSLEQIDEIRTRLAHGAKGGA